MTLNISHLVAQTDFILISGDSSEENEKSRSGHNKTFIYSLFIYLLTVIEFCYFFRFISMQQRDVSHYYIKIH